MATPRMTTDQRRALLTRHEDLYGAFVAAKVAGTSSQEAEELKQAFVTVRQEYYDLLPRPLLSRCPFCEQPFTHTFDPWGPDGFWWIEDAPGETVEPEHCQHFALLQGALDLGDAPPRGHPRLEANVGPAVPFVIPRVLRQEPVAAVVAAIPMVHGGTAYPVVYFTARPLPPGSFTQPWTRKSYSYRVTDGFRWRVDTDPWDFGLADWIQKRKLLWVHPGDTGFRLRSAVDGRCPLIDRPGTRARQFVRDTVVWTLPAPSGEVVEPFNE
jgi:hypothetical protein